MHIKKSTRGQTDSLADASKLAGCGITKALARERGRVSPSSLQAQERDQDQEECYGLIIEK